MCDNWQDEIFDDAISILTFKSFVASIPSKTEKCHCRWNSLVGSVPSAAISSLDRSADLSVQSPHPDNYRDKYRQF